MWKERWVDFHGDLQVNLAWFFAVFSGVLDWIVPILVWFKRSLHSAQVSGQSWPWPLKLMTSRGLERTWIRTGGYGRFRGEWLKSSNVKECNLFTRSFCFNKILRNRLLSEHLQWNFASFNVKINRLTSISSNEIIKLLKYFICGHSSHAILLIKTILYLSLVLFVIIRHLRIFLVFLMSANLNITYVVKGPLIYHLLIPQNMVFIP